MKHASWTRLARADLARIDDFYQELNTEFADRLGRAALAAARFLAQNPRAGAVLEAEVRKWRIASFEYVLLYRVVASGIEVLRMHHARENWRPVPRD